MSKNVVIQEYQNEVEIPAYISVSRVGKNLIKRMLKGKDVIKNRLSPSTQYGPNTFIAFSKNGEEYIFTNKKDFCEVSTFGNKNVIEIKSGYRMKNGYLYLTPKAKLKWIRSDNEYLNCEEISTTWEGKFNFIKEEKNEDGNIVKKGLREPQIGALYATLSHWTISNEPATIVMPTGTGKTETMLSLLIVGQCKKILVVVPTDALREQTAKKFITLGILKEFGILHSSAQNPIVGILNERPKEISEVDELFNKCNVVITTMSIIYGCNDIIQKRFAYHCSQLFIDEAHHITAPTWDAFRQKFIQKTILQFTATPFRNDGKSVDGKIIYNYPLRKAQEEGYFKPINFISVMEFGKESSDRAIAEAAVKQLKKDIKSGLDHILMARVQDISVNYHNKSTTKIHAKIS